MQSLQDLHTRVIAMNGNGDFGMNTAGPTELETRQHRLATPAPPQSAEHPYTL